MTIQDFLMQQMPTKAKADMMFKQHNYEEAANYIHDFAFNCGKADEIFGKDTLQSDTVASIGFNNASLMFAQILNATAKEIADPVHENPYHKKDIHLESNVPEIIRECGIDIAYMSATYSDFVMQSESSNTHIMGFLVALSQLCSIGFYFNRFDTNIITEVLEMLRRGISYADLLINKYPNEEQIKMSVQGFYIHAGMFLQHYAVGCGGYDKHIDLNLEGLEILQKAFDI